MTPLLPHETQTVIVHPSFPLQSDQDYLISLTRIDCPVFHSLLCLGASDPQLCVLSAGFPHHLSNMHHPLVPRITIYPWLASNPEVSPYEQNLRHPCAHPCLIHVPPWQLLFSNSIFVCGMHVREDMFPCGAHVRVALVLESNKVIHRLVPIIGVSKRNRANRSLYVIHTLYIL